jgi:hypothetical protein
MVGGAFIRMGVGALPFYPAVLLQMGSRTRAKDGGPRVL